MGIKKKLRGTAVELYQWFYSNVVGIKKNKVIFLSFNGKSYSDNPRPISEAVHEVCPEAEIVWLFLKPEEKKDVVPPYVRIVNASSRKEYFKELCTSKVFVSNFPFPKLRKHKKQYFIQTWHGDRGFKKVLLDATHSHVWEQIDGYCDLAIAGSDYGERVYRTAFGYNGKVLNIGMPRDDQFVNPDPERIRQLREKLNIPEGTKTFLYAPTLRDQARDAGVEQKAQDIDIQRTIDALEKKYGCPWICLARAHPGVIGLCGVEYSDTVRNMTSYEDMNDLLLMADLLITDYSTTAADFPLMNRPVLLFQSDIQDYTENTRPLYFDMKDTPYYVAHDQQSLEKLIENLNEEDVRENCKAILKFYGTHECGTSALEVAKIIQQQIS